MKMENGSVVCTGTAVLRPGVLDTVKIKVPLLTHLPNRKTDWPIPIFMPMQFILVNN